MDAGTIIERSSNACDPAFALLRPAVRFSTSVESLSYQKQAILHMKRRISDQSHSRSSCIDDRSFGEDEFLSVNSNGETTGVLSDEKNSTAENKLHTQKSNFPPKSALLKQNSEKVIKRRTFIRRNSLGSSLNETGIAKQRKKWVEYLSLKGLLVEMDASRISVFQKWKRSVKSPPPVRESSTTLTEFFGRASYSVRHTIASLADAADPNSRQFTHLVRNGIPPEHRGHVWWVCSGGQEKKEKAKEAEQYHSLLEYAKLSPPDAAQDIEKDLYRTFPNNAAFESEEGIANLRRVLLAYSVRNPEVGYCQSMNFIVALLLLHMDEEEAFWVLAATVEDLLPKYYTHCMSGSHTDQRVFMDIVKVKLPHIHAHLNKLRAHLEPLTLKWFLCMFVNTLPLDVTLRVWDCFFHEGSRMLFRVGLALLKIRSSYILEADDAISVYEALRVNEMQLLEYIDGRSGISSISDLLMKTCFDKSWIGTFPMDKISALREGHKSMVEAELEDMRQRHGSSSCTAKQDENCLEVRVTKKPKDGSAEYSATYDDKAEYDFVEEFYEKISKEGCENGDSPATSDCELLQAKVEVDVERKDSVDTCESSINDDDLEVTDALETSECSSLDRSLDCSGYIDPRYSHRLRSLSAYFDGADDLVIEDYW